MSAPLGFTEFDDRYRVSTRARRTLSFLRGANEKQARKILRGHWEKAIIDPVEIRIRDNLDYLLAAYGLVEIIIHLHGERSWFPADQAAQAAEILHHPAVALYYLETYPLVLPQLLRARLAEKLPEPYVRAARLDHGSDTADVIISLLELDRRRLTEESLEMFLGMLDGYSHRGWFIDDALEAVASAERVRIELLKDARKGLDARRTRAMDVLAGLDAFFRYARDLRQLLMRHEGQLAGALIWLHHGYFYGESAESVQLTIEQVRDLLADLAVEKSDHVIAGERAAIMIEMFDELADRSRWLAPAFEAGLAPFIERLDPPRE